MNSKGSNLYYIAIIPPEIIRKQVKAFKEYMSENFDAKHALKSPAHITLQRPFRREQSFEKALKSRLEEFGQAQSIFSINLNGFSCFTPRVIYVNPELSLPLAQLHASLNKHLIDMGFEAKEMNESIHPHMTIATRDLSEDNFYSAWNEFQSKIYKAQFMVESVFLLKHNGKFWDIICEFPLNKPFA